MKQELEQQLVEKYPTLFRDYGKSPQESCMAFGVEFGDGWYKIFDELCAYLIDISEQEEWVSPKDGGDFISFKRPTIHFNQVKEKYGTMRVYWSWEDTNNYEMFDENEVAKRLNYLDKKIQNAIDYVEFLSSRTCEVCGKPGTLNTEGWYMVRCTGRFCGK